MRFRIELLAQHGLRLPDIQSVIAGMAPMAGAREFLDGLRARFQVIILSDTFYEFAAPLMRQLGSDPGPPVAPLERDRFNHRF